MMQGRDDGPEPQYGLCNRPCLFDQPKFHQVEKPLTFSNGWRKGGEEYPTSGQLSCTDIEQIVDSDEQDYPHTPLRNFVLQVENFITTEGSAQIQDIIHTRKQICKVEYNVLSNSVPKFMKTKIQVCHFGKSKEALEIQDKFHHERVEELLAFDLKMVKKCHEMLHVLLEKQMNKYLDLPNAAYELAGTKWEEISAKWSKQNILDHNFEWVTEEREKFGEGCDLSRAAFGLACKRGAEALIKFKARLQLQEDNHPDGPDKERHEHQSAQERVDGMNGMQLGANIQQIIKDAVQGLQTNLNAQLQVMQQTVNSLQRTTKGSSGGAGTAQAVSKGGAGACTQRDAPNRRSGGKRTLSVAQGQGGAGDPSWKSNKKQKNQQTPCFTAGAGGQKKQPHQNPKQKRQDQHSGQDEDSSGTGNGKGQGPRGVRQQQHKPMPHYKDHSHNLNQSIDWGRGGRRGRHCGHGSRGRGRGSQRGRH